MAAVTFEDLLREVYDDVGGDKLGGLGDFQISALMKRLGFNVSFFDQTLMKWFKASDKDGDKRMNFEELVQALNKDDPYGLERAEAVIRYKFNKLDGDGDKTLSTAELEQWLKDDKMDTSEVFQLESDFDKNMDGKVTMAEFMEYYRKTVTEKMSGFEVRMKRLFKQTDTLGDGLNPFELKLLLKEVGVCESKDALEKWLKDSGADLNGDRKLSWEEFKAVIDRIEGLDEIKKESDLRFQFAKMDKDGSGKLSRAELKDAAILDKTPGLRRALDMKMLTGDDQQIDYEEMIAAWKKCNKQ